MKTRASLSVLCVLAALGVVPSACGGSKKPAEDASEAMGTASSDESKTAPPPPSDSSSAPAASASADAPAPLGSVFNSGSSSDQKAFEALSSAPALATDKKGAKPDALAKRVHDQAKKAAPGMKEEGALARATLKEGDRAQTDLTLEAGKCYAVVAAAETSMKDLDLQLMVPPGVMSAQDNTDDEVPVIGSTPNPFCPDATTHYKLGLYAEKGSGAAAVQLYSKKK